MNSKNLTTFILIAIPNKSASSGHKIQDFFVSWNVYLDHGKDMNVKQNV